VQDGLADAVVTAPIAKESWHLAGRAWPGHTEYLAHLTKAKQHAMMFAGGELKVALATTHVPLSGLWGTLNIGAIFRPIELLDAAMRDWFGVVKPRIAVCGLNPHAGENGLFGDEEDRLIKPALRMAREQGIDATGPHPGDTVFLAHRAGKYDAVVAMYHDQGLIPVKLLGFHEAVNLTLGLPIVRTSPDHGTAFDIAGKNRADSGSMRAALRMAIDLAEQQKHRPAAQIRKSTAARQ
jgi:4-hydroxythreonine-4-phosphate dehydrogenase